jgi:Spy/CpxP family protein refolding chaperone
MKKDLKTILFIASVALNVVFAATYATYKLPSIAGVPQPAPRGPVYLQLDLTPEQLTRFKAERDQFHAQILALGLQIKTKQIELIDLLEATPTDQQTIERKQEEIQLLQRAVQDRVIVHFLQESSHLSSEQRTRFFQLVKARIETSVQACPPWMKPLEKEHSGEKLK